MTEAEWVKSAYPEPMVGFLSGIVSDRKARRFVLACLPIVLPYIDERITYTVEVLEEFAEGVDNTAELARAQFHAQQVLEALRGDPSEQRWHYVYVTVADCLVYALSLHQVDLATVSSRCIHVMDTLAGVRESHILLLEERSRQVRLIRDIFGNPFRPVSFSPDWRTSTVVALARGIYESRDFSPMPILADALEDAGCNNADILDHCRDTKATHVRGCWVVDLVLGKE